MNKEMLSTRLDEARNEGFTTFMNDPLTRMAISLVPSTEGEVLRTILKAAFLSGFRYGQGASMMEVAGILVDGMAKKRKEEEQ